MKVKICGMTQQEQIALLENTGKVDLIGQIFHPDSPRFVTEPIEMNGTMKKTGVFVDATLKTIVETAKKHQLDVIQLHGKELPETCLVLKTRYKVIKAFGVDKRFDFKKLKPYEKAVNYFLFDTKSAKHGGSGQQFDWRILENYTLSVPFFLSGGLRPDTLEAIRSFSHPQFAGIDLNSGFEMSPGIKDIPLIEQFLTALT